MLRYILRRVLQIIPLLLIISFIVFSLIQIAPYDAIDAIATPNMSLETREILRQRHGLDQPFIQQFFTWLTNMMKGDFGRSLVTQYEISQELIERIPNTLLLALPAYFTAVFLAIILGLLSASRYNRLLDQCIDFFMSIGLATPTFWLAMVMIYIFALRLGWAPTFGMHTIGREGDIADLLRHMALPYTVLTIAYLPSLTRFIRSSAVTQLSQDYISVQHSLAATTGEIFRKHVSRNSLLPLITRMGMDLPLMVTGAIVTETIFAWPGVGPYFIDATRKLDYPVIMAIMLLSSFLVIIGNLVSDILYSIVDPRIRQGGR